MQTITASLGRIVIHGLLWLGAVGSMTTLLHAQTNVLIPSHALWKFLDDGSEPPPLWISLGYNDAAWGSGYAPLGYGEPGVITTPTTQGRTTNYFRQTFFLPTAPNGGSAGFRLWRDDGARVFVNDTLVFDDGTRSGEWTPPQQSWFNANTLYQGTNIVAVEVHQVNATSSDLVFDFELFVTNAAPPAAVSITSPANNSLVRIGSNLMVQASVSGLSNVSAVQFYTNGILLGSDPVAPYSVVWTNVPAGSHLLVAIALSPTLNATSSPVQITGVANIAPSVQITSPASNAIVNTGDIAIQVNATDGDGTVTNVSFFESGVKIGEDTNAPYAFVWPGVPEGEYFLTARATDNEGLTATSSVVRIVVQTPPPAGLVRGPYLQIGTPTNIIIKWRTDVMVSSRVRFGTNQLALNGVAQDAAAVTNHEVKLNGLKPDTKYWYEIGSTTEPLVSGADYFFVTAPAAPKPTRIWAIGDSGTATDDARAVAAAYKTFAGTRHTDLWLMLGDNAYGVGSDTDYQRAVFNFYPTLLRQFVLWPALGNHEGAPDYYDIFTLPTQGEAGGVPSGTEHYYSFEYGNIHFICLDAAYLSRGQGQPMWTWLQADLEAHTNQWLIAYWHQPPYSKGSHNSDVEIDLMEMRQNFVPLLEQYGVDLVLNGHSHCYERSHFLNGHYGLSDTLDSGTMFVDPGNGRSDGDGAYRKATVGPQAGRGTVYVVAGSSGWATFGALNHPAMHTSYLRMGSLVVDVDGPRLDAKFLRLTGEIDDYFTIVKDTSDFFLTTIQYINGDVNLTWASRPGKSYRIHHAATLGESFVPVSEVIPSVGTTTSYTHQPPTGSPLGFYRAVELP